MPDMRLSLDGQKPPLELEREGELFGVTHALHELLLGRSLRARLRCQEQSVLVGCGLAAQEVEFEFKDRAALRRLLSHLRLYDWAKAYFDQDLSIYGSFEAAIEILYAINICTDREQSAIERAQQLLFRIAKTVPPFTKRFESDPHYSVRADAYGLFLDRYLQYTCGKFRSPYDTLEEAQINKFKLIANLASRHLGRLDGLEHMDIGCGWGGLISYFQNVIGTRSTGITNNRSQRCFAREHFGVDPLLGDFANLRRHGKQYDLVTIVGMAEHLTPARRNRLFEVIGRILRDDGLVYFQCIAKPDVWIGGDAYRIASEDVFPGHQLELAADMEIRFRRLGFDVLYAVDDAQDYSRTTALWAQNLQRNQAVLVPMMGEKSFRIFLGYISYASKLFGAGRGSLKRYVLRKRKGQR